MLYLEGSTDLALLSAFAQRLNHQTQEYLARPFVHDVTNQPRKALEHFYGLREAKPALVGIAIYDHLEKQLSSDPSLRQYTWRKRELENDVCQRETLLAYALAEGERTAGLLFAQE